MTYHLYLFLSRREGGLPPRGCQPPVPSKIIFFKEKRKQTILKRKNIYFFVEFFPSNHYDKKMSKLEFAKTVFLPYGGGQKGTDMSATISFLRVPLG